MLRRIFLAFTLALLFGLGQQGAAMHAVTHIADAHEQQQDKKHNSSTCEQCVAYAKLAGAVPSTALQLPEAAGRHLLVAQPSLTTEALDSLAYSARAPPVLS